MVLTSPPSGCRGHSIARPGPSLAARAAGPVTSRACDLLSALVQRSRHPKANVFIREKTNSSCHYFQPKGSARMFSDRRSDVDHGAYPTGHRALRASLLRHQVLQIPAQSPGPPRPRELLEKRPREPQRDPWAHIGSRLFICSQPTRNWIVWTLRAGSRLCPYLGVGTCGGPGSLILLPSD